jgi:hypothetical protein
MFDLRPWAQSLPDSAERGDVVEELYRAWKRMHPDGTMRGFWLGVSTGEIQIPGAPYLHSSSPPTDRVVRGL